MNRSKLLSFFTILIASFIVAWCGAPVWTDGEQWEQLSWSSKPLYRIEVQSLERFSTDSILEKNWTIAGAQDIQVTAQVQWEVRAINRNIGDRVLAGQNVIQLNDTIANYGISLERADITLDTASLNYNNTQLTLDKNIKDAQLAFEKAQQDFVIVQEQSQQSLKKALEDLQNSEFDNENSSAGLSLRKTETELDNDLDSLKLSLVSQRQSLFDLIQDTLYQTDILLWASKENQTVNDDFDLSLWARNISQKSDAIESVLDLYEIQESIAEITVDKTISDDELFEVVAYFDDVYNHINDTLEETLDVLKNSVESQNFSRTEIDTYVATIGGVKSTYLSLYSSFIAYSDLVDGILEQVSGTWSQRDLTQQDREIARSNAEIQRTSAQIAYENTLISIKDGLYEAELGVTNAKNTLDNVLAIRNTQLALLGKQIEEASASYRNTKTTYNKLSVRSPVPWRIKEVYVDVGQEVAPWTPLFSVVGNAMQEVRIFVNDQERQYLFNGKNITIRTRSEDIVARVSNISSIANGSFQYQVIIVLEQDVPLVGDFVDVLLPVSVDETVLPLDVVTVTQQWKWYIYAWHEWKIQKLFIELGDIRDNKIVVHSVLPQKLQIITTSMSNFDANKFDIEHNNKRYKIESIGITVVSQRVSPDTLEVKEEIKIDKPTNKQNATTDSATIITNAVKTDDDLVVDITDEIDDADVIDKDLEELYKLLEE